MKIAAFNVENLFDRAKAFNEESSISNVIIQGISELNNLFEKQVYSENNKIRMLELFKSLGLEKNDNGTYVVLRKIRGKIIYRPRKKPIQINANGREDWIGWAELKTAPVNEIAVLNTGRVIRDVNADVLAVVEAEDRTSLEKFSQYILNKVGDISYEQVMLIDGNDERGIDVGVMTKNNYKIDSVKSHIYDLRENGNKVFSRDSPEYRIITPNGNIVWVIPNHFKSKYGGNNPASKLKRKAQSIRVAEIYRNLINSGELNIIVLGDLNDTPYSEELEPLLGATDLKDVSLHNTFNPGEFEEIGTFNLGNDENKIDYLLLSPNLFNKVNSSGLFRIGAWAGKRPKRWETYESIKKKIHVASDHHVIWADINI